jgi:mannosyltransferase OCH1-like enzyme
MELEINELLNQESENDEQRKEQNDSGEVVENDIKIPKRIFQTHKTIEYIQSKPKLQRAMNSWRRYVPEFGYHFYTDELCADFMKTEMVEEFGEIIYDVYNKLPLQAKAELWRYCAIYVYGGIYANTDTICKCNPNMFTLYDTMLVCAPEYESDHIGQKCFAAPARSPILRTIIELSFDRIMNVQDDEKLQDEHVLHYVIGPGLFTDGIEKYLKSINSPVYANKKQYYLYKNPTMICFKAERFHKMMILDLVDQQWNESSNNI